MNEEPTTSPSEGATTKDPEEKKGVRIFEGKLHRAQRGHGKTFVEGPPQPPPEPVRRPARVAVMLALAHKIEDAIRRGVVRDRAEVARRLGLTRARLTQLMDLTLLAPDLQEQILFLESVDGIEPMSERTVRSAAQVVHWPAQTKAWTTFLYSVLHCRRSIGPREDRMTLSAARFTSMASRKSRSCPRTPTP